MVNSQHVLCSEALLGNITLVHFSTFNYGAACFMDLTHGVEPQDNPCIWHYWNCQSSSTLTLNLTRCTGLLTRCTVLTTLYQLNQVATLFQISNGVSYHFTTVLKGLWVSSSMSPAPSTMCTCSSPPLDWSSAGDTSVEEWAWLVSTLPFNKSVFSGSYLMPRSNSPQYTASLGLGH